MIHIKIRRYYTCKTDMECVFIYWDLRNNNHNEWLWLLLITELVINWLHWLQLNCF